MGKKRPKAPKWVPSRKDLEKILEVDNKHAQLEIIHVCYLLLIFSQDPFLTEPILVLLAFFYP
jgi:hypothetical protein